MPVQFFPLEHVTPNPFQPRETMDPTGIAELAANILATRASAPDTFGLLQTPRARKHGPGVQLAYGHRRLAAFQLLAGQGHSDYSQFPVELADISDADMAIVAWSENVARADINPMEQARFIRRLMNEFGWTIKIAAARPSDIQDQVADGQIATARALELVSLMDRVGEDELRRLAHTAGKASHRAFHQQINRARRQTAAGADLMQTVIEPAAQVLANAIKADEPGAWLVLARTLDPQAADVDSAGDLALLVMEKTTLRSLSLHDGRKRVNTMFEAAGLVPPWNAAATEKVTEFLAWRRQKNHKRARSA